MFFQAEDGIRAHCVTGVQTCALPISPPPPPAVEAVARTRASAPGGSARGPAHRRGGAAAGSRARPAAARAAPADPPARARSEERRVGKECRYRRLLNAESQNTNA